MRDHGKAIRGAYKTAITREMFENILKYDPDSGLFFWKYTNAHHKAGDIAGIRNKRTGYICICAFGLTFEAHRLAYLFMTGTWPRADVDHKYGIRDDNRWSELRAATRSENLSNRVGFSKSGHKHIEIMPRKRGTERYRVSIRRGEVFFQSRVLPTLEAAVTIRDEWLRDHGGEFINTSHRNDTF